MSNPEPSNLVLEQLRAMRAENSKQFEELKREIAGLKVAVRGIGHQTLAEDYKANKTFGGFSDLEARLEAVERKVFA